MKNTLFTLALLSSPCFAGSPGSVIAAVESVAPDMLSVTSVTSAPGAECGGCADYKIKGIDATGNRLIEVKVSTRLKTDGTYSAEIIH